MGGRGGGVKCVCIVIQSAIINFVNGCCVPV